MKSNTKIVIVALVLVLAIAIGGTIAYEVYNTSNSYIATMAGEKISKAEFQFFLRMIKDDYESKAGVDYQSDEAKKNFWKTPINGEDAETAAKNDALKEVQKFKIMLEKAKESNLTLSSEDLEKVKSTMDNMILQEGNGDRIAADKAIKSKYWISISDYETIYKDYMLAFGKYASIEADKIKITDEQLRSEYKDKMDKEGKVTVWEVFLETKDSSGKPLSTDKVNEKAKLAQEVLDKANKGDDFSNLVSQYTDDVGAKQSGGEFSVSKDEKMPKEYLDWVFKAKEGDIGLVNTSNGYYIIKRPRFAELKETLMRSYQLDEVNKKLDQWMKEDQYKLEKNNSALNSISLY
ncbi:MAG: peptidylprolyl isomerase [Bacillota bacterium]|nr:peptidylprolyl isomerase [Bacillota bacterium]